MIGDIQAEPAARAARTLTDEGLTAAPVIVDVTGEDQVQAAVQHCLDAYRHLDVFMNNAGITRDATMRKMSLEQFRSVVDFHQQGCWLGTRAAAAVMREQAAGSIVNISSTSGKTGMLGQTNFSAAKVGMVGLAKAAAKEIARYGVRVNVVRPGLVRTPMTESMRQDIWDQKLAEVSMARGGDPDEVANVVLFLASDLSPIWADRCLRCMDTNDRPH